MESESPIDNLVNEDSLHVGVDIGGSLSKLCVLAGANLRDKVLTDRDKSLDCRAG